MILVCDVCRHEDTILVFARVPYPVDGIWPPGSREPSNRCPKCGSEHAEESLDPEAEGRVAARHQAELQRLLDSRKSGKVNEWMN